MDEPVRFPVLLAILCSLPFVPIACSRSGGGGTNALAPPSGVTATAGLGQVTIDWSTVTGATSYNLYWSTTPGVTKATGTQVAGVTTPHLHVGLTVGTTYYYVLTSLRDTAEGAESTEVFATPTALPPPGCVKATGGDSQVTIDWQAVPGATSYNLYWSTTPGVTKATGTQVAGVTAPYLHVGLTNGTKHYYVLTSLQGPVEGMESMEVSATPGPPALGVLDTTFGGLGWVTHDNAAGGSASDLGYGITTDASGRILVAGTSENAAGNYDMAIWRYNDDGSLDTTFNGQGWVVHDGAAGGGDDDYGGGITVDCSGRILVAGCSINASNDLDMVIWAYDSTGTLDATFGTGGVAVHDNAAGGNSLDEGFGIALDASGRILVAGDSTNASNDRDMVIWAYDSTGTLDATFGTGGVAVHHNAAGGNDKDFATAIALDASGRILSAGWSRSALGTLDMVIWRYDSTGTLDTTFGTGGVVVHDNAAGGTPGADLGWAIVVDPSGRILVAGCSGNLAGNSDMVIWRYNDDGNLDTTFNGQGWVVHGGAAGGSDDDNGYGITVHASGRILVTGHSMNAAGNWDMVIWAYDSTGTLDATFGTGGVVVHHNAAGGNDWDWGRAITLDAAGRILVAGPSASAANGYDMVIWRYR